MCLCRETDEGRHEIVGGLLLQPQSDVHALACSCGPGAKHMLVIGHKQLEDVNQADRVDGGDNNLLILGTSGDVVLWNGLHPRNPSLLLQGVEEAEQVAAWLEPHQFYTLLEGRHWNVGLLHIHGHLIEVLLRDHRPDIPGKNLLALAADAAAKRPNQAKNEQWNDGWLQVSDRLLERSGRLQLIRHKLHKVTIQQAEQRLDEVVVLTLNNLGATLAYEDQSRRDQFSAESAQGVGIFRFEAEGLRQHLDPRVIEDIKA
mmetsp:Transcript_139279/g.362082  ORF Transcript_139279/g.362082 Transcript_139279/m.362082 type:complete len:259 (-) Transcript_139279:5891-6667(-)